MNRRDLFRLFGTGATIVVLDKGVPLLAEPARLIEPAKVEPARFEPTVIGSQGMYEIIVRKKSNHSRSLLIHTSTFTLKPPQYEIRQLVGYRYPVDVVTEVSHTWEASGEMFSDVDQKVMIEFFYER